MASEVTERGRRDLRHTHLVMSIDPVVRMWTIPCQSDNSHRVAVGVYGHLAVCGFVSSAEVR